MNTTTTNKMTSFPGFSLNLPTKVDTTYNGWTNYETWNVALWMQNDEFLYNTAIACVEYREENESPYDKFIRCMLNCDNVTTGDDVAWNDELVNTKEVNEMMLELVG